MEHGFHAMDESIVGKYKIILHTEENEYLRIVENFVFST